MPPTAESVLIGLTEVGHVTDPYGTPADVSWGATEQNGAEVRLDGQTVDIQSAQSKVLEEQFLAAVNITVVVRLQYSDLLNVARMLGLDEASYPTGDLQAGTPTDEVLEPLITDIGEREFYLYLLTPGPASTRRFEFKRCKASPSASMALGSQAAQVLEISFGVLKPKQAGEENKPFKITDAAA